MDKNRFSKTDYLHNVKYYSTFHIKSEYLKYYIDDLIEGFIKVIENKKSINEIFKIV